MNNNKTVVRNMSIDKKLELVDLIDKAREAMSGAVRTINKLADDVLPKLGNQNSSERWSRHDE